MDEGGGLPSPSLRPGGPEVPYKYTAGRVHLCVLTSGPKSSSEISEVSVSPLPHRHGGI